LVACALTTHTTSSRTATPCEPEVNVAETGVNPFGTRSSAGPEPPWDGSVVGAVEVRASVPESALRALGWVRAEAPS
jgi:hypothetical protein